MTTNQSNQTVPDNIVELIHKCLALSESLNEFEAELAMSKVQELLLKYNLSIDTIKDLPPADDDLAQLIDCYVEVNPTSWYRYLYNEVSALNYCKVIGHGNNKNISILGRMVNVQSTIEMTQWLISQIERLSLEASRAEFNPSRSFKTSFCFGCAKRVYERLVELQNEIISSNNTARGLIVRLDQETREWVKANYPLLVHGTKYNIGSSDGFQTGQTYGDRVSVIRPSMSIEDGRLKLNSGR